MTREEAKQALAEGKKITHMYFSPNEYVYQQGVMIFTEEGYSIDQEIFWRDRARTSFNHGWEIYSDDIIVNPETERFIEHFSDTSVYDSIMNTPAIYSDGKGLSAPSKSKRAQLRKKRKKRNRGKK